MAVFARSELEGNYSKSRRRSSTFLLGLMPPCQIIAPSAVALVDNALQSKGDRKYRVTARCGWHNDKTFVYPTATYGELAKELRWDGCNDIDPALGQRHGALKEWREGMREPVKYSDYLILASSIPLASALLDVIGEDEGAVFHLHGINAQGYPRENQELIGQVPSCTRRSLGHRALQEKRFSNLRRDRSRHRRLLLRSQSSRCRIR